MSEEPAKTIDLRGLSCPMPILKTKKEIKTIEIGEVLAVLASDPGAKEDFPRWAKRTNNELLKVEDKGDYMIFYIKRNS